MSNPPRWASKAFQLTQLICLEWGKFFFFFFLRRGKGKLVYNGRTKEINQENINWKNKEVRINKTKHE